MAKTILLTPSERKLAELLIDAQDAARMFEETSDPELKNGLLEMFHDRLDRSKLLMQRTGAKVIQAGLDYVRSEIETERARMEKKRRDRMRRPATTAEVEIIKQEYGASVFDGLDIA